MFKAGDILLLHNLDYEYICTTLTYTEPEDNPSEHDIKYKNDGNDPRTADYPCKFLIRDSFLRQINEFGRSLQRNL